ncbi:hypothetical protein EB230_01025 [Mesorhizobium sp. NZP2234]|uniref:hypothetical protein n=1 Tax=Mesorhizobium sp. NZP2234 TaxID=2483402 RepID=UPI0015559488|nr:hypothetical protein [Mesorhizobium sp. NZP2234]QKC87171.1 hypothetical protein EB230_01025 [Mesorhizobium sp. NZP2234]
MTKNPNKTTHERQIDKFKEAARELKTDQSDAAFEAVVDKIAHAPKLTQEQIKELVRRRRET